MNSKLPESIDAYIATFPKDVQKMLQAVRTTIQKAAPEAKEAISYAMPTFKLNGNLVHFAGYKNHIGFYPAPMGIEAFKKELSVYKGAKGSVQFPLDKPMPLILIAKIVKYRVQKNLEKQKPKKPAPEPTSKKSTNSEQVSAHIAALDPTLAKTVEMIRQIILSVDKNIGEQIKWNNPSFYYTGEMKPFDPKEYKRDIAVFNLHKRRIMLVFPTGAKVADTKGLLEGDYQDGRRMITFKDMDDVVSKKKTLREIIKKWIALVD